VLAEPGRRVTIPGVRQPWQWLAGCSLVSLAGIAWLIARVGAPASAWGAIEMLGMVASAGIGIAAALASHAKKWPAAVALACALPMAQNIVLAFPTTMELMLHLGVPYLMFLLGAIGAVAASIAALVMRPPRPEEDEVVARAPRAR
jgi:hypothetical protein